MNNFGARVTAGMFKQRFLLLVFVIMYIIIKAQFYAKLLPINGNC